jgi:hypothetical protein
MCCYDIVCKYVVMEVFEVFMSISCCKIYNGVEVKSCCSGLLDIAVYM